MKRTLLMITAVILAGTLLLANPSMAHHLPNEKIEFTSKSGDPAYHADAQSCLDQIGENTPELHCVVLYGHIFDLLNAVPINIQRPAPQCESLARGFSSQPPVEPYWSFARQVLYSSPGFVEYDGSSCEDPRIHPERGLSSDVNVAQDVNIFGHWYMSADSTEVSAVGLQTGGQGPAPHMGVMPCLTVRMELWTMRFIGQGEPLATGQTTKTVVSTPLGSGQEEEAPAPDPCPDSEGNIVAEEVSEIVIDMGQISREIREHEGFVVGIYWYMHDNGDPGEENNVYHREWNLHTGPDYPNRLVLAVEDSIRVESVRPQEFDNMVYILSVLNSPWGSYDVDTANLIVQLFDEDGNEVEMNHLQDPLLRYSVDHDGHFKPVNATFPWDARQEGLEPGEYTIRVSATNWQHTSDAFAEATLEISEGQFRFRDNQGNQVGGDNDVEDQEAPAAGVLLVTLAILGMAGIVSLRRRR